ncbi:MAG: hypothetical protein FWH24_04910, partial [Oscillospiraceae bacterium]|nr:hypothetical protein [Oscillospiraceae bacterium]
DEAGSFARRVIQAGDTAFDSAALTMNNTIELAQNGMWVDLNTVRNIDLEKPWWDQGANYGMSIGGKLFLTSGDFNLVSRDACPGLLFNKQLLANFQLEDPYALARAGQWTLGKLYEMTRDGGADLNGDGLMEWEVDRFGLITQRDAVIAFLHGAGGRFTAKDSNDMPEWVFGNDRTFAVMDSVFDVMLNEENVFNMHWAPEPIYPKSEMMFQEDRGLFMWVRLRIVENLRGMETDFGIMPMPWFDETQGTWHHTVNRYTGHAMAIPMFHDDDELDRTGFILEAISAESKYTVIPAYYDVQLSTQIARDEESSDMLDIIFSTTVWDTGEIYNWADFSGNLLNLIHTRNRNLASLWDRSEDRVQTMMQRTLDKYEELD